MTKKDKAEEKFIIGKPYLELNEEVNFNPALPWFREIYPIYPLADKKKRHHCKHRQTASLFMVTALQLG